MKIRESTYVPCGWSTASSSYDGIVGFDFGFGFGNGIFVSRVGFIFWTFEVRYKRKRA